ncbi:squalene synthetase-like protein [Lithohypha guttulata]|nr:squalene synthetase-like protein [Lithohypha guttulata]
MGAKQRAQNRGKKAARGSMKGQPMSQKQLNQSILVPELDPASRSRSLQNWSSAAQSSSSGGHHGFSMSEEARNTDRRTAAWGTTSLRTQGISFVSAGPLKREEDAWNTVSEDDSPLKQSDVETTVVRHTQAVPEESSPTTREKEALHEPAADSNTHDAQPVTTHQVDAVPFPTTLAAQSSDSNNAAPAPAPTVVEPPVSPSSESDEEILFAGRSAPSRLPSRKPTPAPPAVVQASKQVEASPGAVSTTKQEQQMPDPAIYQNSIPPSPASDHDDAQDLNGEPPISARTRSKRETDKTFHPSLFSRNEDALMQDYIENMALDDSEEDDEEQVPGSVPIRKSFKKTQTFRMFNGDGLENAKVQTRNRGSTVPIRDVPEHAFDWNSDDLADFDDLSTTDEEVDDVGQVIRHRTRVSGAQYLIIADGADASDAKWMLHGRLTSESAIKEIQIYEEIRQMNIEEDDIDDDDDDSEEEDEEDEEALQDLIDNIESEDDENARIINYTARMTDEQIARALAKQEELGLGSDELMLFDGEAPEEEEMDDVFGANNDFISFNLGKHTSNRGRSKRNKKQRDSFPSAEAFADALDQDPYGAFDVMDFERPSLRPTKKGRKSDFPWDLGDLDEELRDQLVNTWTKDREKKAERKRQREEARLTATLDAADAGDPAIIKTRIRQFLVQDVDELRLSPMEAAVRAAVHRLAKSLKLHSRSEGKEGIGLGRYPVLTKTSRTPQYTFETIWQIDALMNTRKFFPKHMGAGSKKTPRVSGAARPARRGGGGGIMTGATYRDGEIVGASAPEIGVDNKGRAMLEKMGWTAGMGIGAEGNKGSLEHVRHIVKTSKAGLG